MGKRDVFSFPLSRVYPLLVAKVEKKGGRKEEVDRAISWLFGYSPADVERMMVEGTLWGEFIASAPSPNPRRFEKKGRVCSVRVEDIPPSPERDMRILDLMVDEIARGKNIEEILLEKD